ncbi:hypothetical protein J2Z23_001732 [Lederbergia galactosidilyticus]|nr:hypothetical protein [Lederbergia galactosidilytica]
MKLFIVKNVYIRVRKFTEIARKIILTFFFLEGANIYIA